MQWITVLQIALLIPWAAFCYAVALIVGRDGEIK